MRAGAVCKLSDEHARTCSENLCFVEQRINMFAHNCARCKARRPQLYFTKDSGPGSAQGCCWGCAVSSMAGSCSKWTRPRGCVELDKPFSECRVSAPLTTLLWEGSWAEAPKVSEAPRAPWPWEGSSEEAPEVSEGPPAPRPWEGYSAEGPWHPSAAASLEEPRASRPHASPVVAL